VGDGVLLIGDAAGLSHSQSGEGILPAIESALLAADTILAARGDYRRGSLEPYATRLAARPGSGDNLPASPLASALLRFIGARLLSSRWFVRHIVLDRWFLHANNS
jgi:2-polyprenyl-6-methoxyphenol hydroxylase-like FAD-dependent oxidoreductase